MTNKKEKIVDITVVEDSSTQELSFDDKARALLTDHQYREMKEYIDRGGHELALSTGQKFFELYLNGEAVEEIHRLNPTFPSSAIHWMRIKYNWDDSKTNHIMTLQHQVAEKVMKAQLEVASLYSDILAVAAKQNGDRLKKYLQTGNDEDLGGVLKAESLHQIMKTAEALQKITGQDKNIKVQKEEKLDVNVNVNTDGSNLSAETSAKILEAIAEEKRKKDQ